MRIISKVSLDSHTDVLFKEQEILKFSDIHLYQIGKFIYLKEIYFLIIFVICLLQASYIRIILEIATFFTYLPVELISETSQFNLKDLSFSTR